VRPWERGRPGGGPAGRGGLLGCSELPGRSGLPGAVGQTGRGGLLGHSGPTIARRPGGTPGGWRDGPQATAGPASGSNTVETDISYVLNIRVLTL